jgi:hypothetical protein
MVIDTTVTLGALLNAFVILVGFIIAFVRVGGRLDLLGQRIESLEKAVSNNTDLAARLARTEERQAANTRLISLVQLDLRDVKHGRGFVQNRNGEGINGEYD